MTSGCPQVIRTCETESLSIAKVTCFSIFTFSTALCITSYNSRTMSWMIKSKFSSEWLVYAKTVIYISIPIRILTYVHSCWRLKLERETKFKYCRSRLIKSRKLVSHDKQFLVRSRKPVSHDKQFLIKNWKQVSHVRKYPIKGRKWCPMIRKWSIKSCLLDRQGQYLYSAWSHQSWCSLHFDFSWL